MEEIMNKVMSDITYTEDMIDSIRFYPNTLCTVSTVEGSILECQLDLYKHTIRDKFNVFHSFKPILHEINVNGTIEHINGVFTPDFNEGDTLAL